MVHPINQAINQCINNTSPFIHSIFFIYLVFIPHTQLTLTSTLPPTTFQDRDLEWPPTTAYAVSEWTFALEDMTEEIPRKNMVVHLLIILDCYVDITLRCRTRLQPSQLWTRSVLTTDITLITTKKRNST